MDATRQRRTKSLARQHWYAHWRLLRFACHLGFVARRANHGLLKTSFPTVKTLAARI
jgi:hypothetical protein